LSTSDHRSCRKKVFSPDPPTVAKQLKRTSIGVDASFQVLDIHEYACGLKFGFALISNENPNPETTSEDKRPFSQGFTLAEVLIAIAIFALLVSIVMGSFSGVFSRTEALGTQRANNAMARSCLMRMATDLGSIHVEKPPFFAPPEMADEPSPDRFLASMTADGAEAGLLLQFASRAHVDLSGRQQEGIAVIRYYIEPAGDRDQPLFRLRRSDVIAYGDELPELESDPVICENMTSITFEFLGHDGEAAEDWDSDAEDQGYATPRAVKIRLELSAPEGPAVYETVVALPIWRAASGKV
jgi:prepilin-type N-terminal cleavage/methylation domain-containing protein